MLHDCVMAVLRKEGTVLLCHRHPSREWIPDVWDFPGGHIEADETPEQALVRELAEELGVVIAAPRRPADQILVYEEESTRLAVWFIDYHGRVENRCPAEHDEIRWVDLREAAELRLAAPEYLAVIRAAVAT